MAFNLGYSFEGSLRRKPEQNLSGSSRKHTRDDLLQRAHEERLRRQTERLKLKSVQTIQSYTRSYQVRKAMKSLHRSFLDESTNEHLEKQLGRLLFIFDPYKDQQRLQIICSHVMNEKDYVLARMPHDNKFNWLIKRLLKTCLHMIDANPANFDFASKILNVFANSEDTFAYLIDSGYYKTLAAIYKSPVESDLTLTLIEKPFEFIADNGQMKLSVPREFVAHFMSPPMTLKIRYILIPHLNAIRTFPYDVFVKFICNEHVKQSNNLLFCMLSLEPTAYVCKEYIYLLSELSKDLSNTYSTMDIMHDDADSDDEVMEISSGNLNMTDFVRLFNNPDRVKCLLNFYMRHSDDEELLAHFTNLCHHLLMIFKDSIRKFMLVYMLAIKGVFLRELWTTLRKNYQKIIASSNSNNVCNKWKDSQVPLSVFCDLFTFYTETLTEAETTDISDTFINTELAQISELLKHVAINLIESAFPMCRSNYYSGVTPEVFHLYHSALRAVKKLHLLDIRKKFCDPQFWTERKVHVAPDLAKKNYFTTTLRPFYGVVANSEDNHLPPLSTIEQRSLAILQELPFLLEFNQRVMILRQLCFYGFGNSESRFRSEFYGESAITVRRAYLYEDAFDKLSIRSDDDMRHKLRIQFINNVGLEEAGIDGGGIFKEFINEVIKTAFDPNRGFFLLTGENTLYPNPQVHLLFDNYEEHYYFIGRLVGKAIYENILVDLPLAEFFLAKILVDRASAYYLESLDPVLHRNLLYLRDYKGDVQDLGLDFTLVHNDLGETRIYELIPNGANISVTNYNRLEYIHRLADLKLNSQIKKQCTAFRDGLNSVVPLLWLKLFNNNELQVVISGDTQEMDIDDLKKHTIYGGEYTAEHPTIILFWKVVENFSDAQKKMLLKFVTSCSRPPLLGFKELNPAFGIQSSGAEDRMPTASTCLNLLKLPIMNDEETLKRKILAAIEQQAGFELS